MKRFILMVIYWIWLLTCSLTAHCINDNYYNFAIGFICGFGILFIAEKIVEEKVYDERGKESL